MGTSLTMPFTLRSEGHLFKLARDLYEDDEFSDTTFVTMNGSFHSHSHLLLLHLPFLGDLVCEACRTTHERMVIFLPHVRSELMEMALLELYLRGNADKLGDILDMQSVKEELLEDMDVASIQ